MQCNYVYYTVSTCHRLGSPSFCFFIALCLHTNIPKPLLYNVSVWVHGFVYWKASVFPMTAIEEWGGGEGKQQKKGRAQSFNANELWSSKNYHIYSISTCSEFLKRNMTAFRDWIYQKVYSFCFFSLVGCCCQFNWNLRVQLTSYFVNIESFSA